MRLGVIGAGIVGGNLGKLLASLNHTVLYDDGPKGLNDDLTDCEAIFLCLPVPTMKDRTQDLTLVKERILKWKTAQCPFFLRSTTLPTTADRLSNLTKKTIVAMPEFLTERTAENDVFSQGIICGEPTNLIRPLVERIFLRKNILFMKNQEAEMAKYAHNCFGAYKVMYFNIIYEACKKFSLNYDVVREGVLMSGYIDKNHTRVPGPDLRRGYGGKCFPKDLAAFIGFLSTYQVPTSLLKKVEQENSIIRG